MRSSEKKEASCCNDKIRKSSLILCSFILSHTRKNTFLHIRFIYTHWKASIVSAGFHCQDKDAIKRSREKRFCPGGSLREKVPTHGCIMTEYFFREEAT